VFEVAFAETFVGSHFEIWVLSFFHSFAQKLLLL
jgi:hypothetical protein